VHNSPRKRISTVLLASLTALAVVLTGTAAFAWSARSVDEPLLAITDEPQSAPIPPSEPAPTPPPAPARINNVVLLVADDLDWELFRQVPRLNALQAQGLTFTNHTVTNSLCCPSRVSILRGQYVQNHRIISNIEATGGGWPTYRKTGREADSLPLWVQRTGAKTSFIGKYLNEYPSPRKLAKYVPPGWNDWVVPVSRKVSYSGYNYDLNRNGVIESYGKKPKDFLNDVITKDATDFIRSARGKFFLNFSTYAPHKPFPTADRHRRTHPKTLAPRTPLYNSVGVDAPNWLKKFRPMSERRLANLDRLWQQRARSAESIADSLADIQRTLRATGRDKDTLIIVTSDNGYHVATRRQPKGKRSPYAEDTVVPLVILGPGIIPGTVTQAMTSTIDLAPTITELMGGSAPAWVDGRSLVPFIRNGGQIPEGWRTAVLSQSLGESSPSDPDYEPFAPPMFNALRSQQWLYTVYETGETELYDLVTDPFEQVNIVRSSSPLLIAQLRAQLDALRACSGPTCRIADRLLPASVMDPEESAPPVVTPEEPLGTIFNRTR
jgi:arylsulfatase A-like enzyme